MTGGRQGRSTVPLPPAGRVTVGALLAIASAGPVGYPAWLAMRTRHRPDPAPPEQHQWPPVSVVVPAFREEAVIEAKVADLRRNGYPGELTIVVVADDPATAAAARRTAARDGATKDAAAGKVGAGAAADRTAAAVLVVAPERRIGKAEALNRGVAAATGEVVVLTDANAALRPGSLRAMVRWFADPAVGAVAAEKRVSSEGEGAYWRYESWLKRRESRLAGTIGLVGELAAIRRAAWRPLPPDVAVDDLWLALDVLEAGWQVCYEPAAVATEPPVGGLREDWERRTRVVAGMVDVLWRRRRLLAGHPPVSAQLWGHRLLRSTAGPLAHAALLGVAARSGWRTGPARPWAAGFLTAHLVAGLGMARRDGNGPLSRLAAIGGQVLFLQAVALGGLVRYACGDRPALWRKPERRPEQAALRPAAAEATLSSRPSEAA